MRAVKAYDGCSSDGKQDRFTEVESKVNSNSTSQVTAECW